MEDDETIEWENYGQCFLCVKRFYLVCFRGVSMAVHWGIIIDIGQQDFMEMESISFFFLTDHDCLSRNWKVVYFDVFFVTRSKSKHDNDVYILLDRGS